MKIESLPPNLICEVLAFGDVTCMSADPSCDETN